MMLSMAQLVFLFIFNGSGFVFEYKIEIASVPGQPGSIDYYSIWVGEHQLRRDINNDVSTIIDLEKNIRWELNHLNEVYYVSNVDTEPENITFRPSWPSTERVDSLPCDVFETKVEQPDGNILIKIWISKKAIMTNGKNLLELLTNQSLEQAFGGRVPRGVPVKFSVAVSQNNSNEVIELMKIKLTSQKELDIPPSKFELPLGYILKE